jgi:glycosyltransferase involved in cell wall biosynthesis
MTRSATTVFSNDSVLVGDPGARPELVQAAAAFAERGKLRRYVSPIAVSKEAWLLRNLERRRGKVWARAARQLRLRALPEEIDVTSHASASGVLELLVFGARNANMQGRPLIALVRAKDQWFDRRLSRKLDARLELVLANYGAAGHTLRRCSQLGIPTLLNYPIADHRFTHLLLEEEAKLNPDFAPTLQFVSKSRAMTRALEYELSAADYVLAYCDFHRHTFIESGVPEKKILTVPLGVDLDHFCPMQESPDEDLSRPFRIVYVGQITQRKGLSYAIEGFLRAKIPNSELLLVGKIVGTSNPWSNIRGVRHLDHLSRSELPSVYRSSDVFLMPSLIEGFGLTALEALACGVPCIITPNVLGDNFIKDGCEGYTVPIRDPDAIADRLSHLYADHDALARMGMAARLHACKYSWDNYRTNLVAQVSSAVFGEI